MSDTLFFRYNTDDSIDWYLSAGDATRYGGSLSEAAALCPGKKIVVMIPGRYVHLSTHTIPARQRQKILQAAPFAMEEELIGDIEDFHFALPAKIPPDSTPVCAIRHQTMMELLARFNQHHIHPHAFIPEPLLLPYTEQQWTLLLDDQELHVRTGWYTGFTVDADDANTYVKLALKEDKTTAPQQINLIDVRTLASQDTAPFSDLDIPVQSMETADGLLATLAQQYDEQQTINLLQGAYAARKVRNQNWRKWMPAAVVVAALVLLQLISAGIHYQQMDTELEQLDQQISQQFSRALPNTRQVDPRAQMRQHLQALRQSASTAGGGFMSLLARSANHLSADSSIQINNLSYRNGHLDIAINIGNLQALEALKQKFIQAGLNVDIRSAAVQGETVTARIRLQGGNT